MKYSSFIPKIILSVLLYFLPWHVYAQLFKHSNYKIETGINFSNGSYAPFWFVSNKQGLSSVTTDNGYIRAGVFRPLEKEKKFSCSWGVDVVSGYGFTSSFVLQQAYLDLQYHCWNVSIGSKERYGELKNSFLSSGALTFSGNARPVPQIRISVPGYWNFKPNGLFAIKGHLAYGIFTDDSWQKDFVKGHNKYTEHVLYHSKALFVRVGNEKRFPLAFEGGLEMAAQFGGNSFHRNGSNYEKTDMPNHLRDFFKVLVPSSGDSTTPMGEQTNIYGNHVGSWHLFLSYKFDTWKLRTYYEHYFEDHSMMFWQYGWKDCLAGVEITFPKNRIIGELVYEYLGTKDQTGPVYHDTTEWIPDQISAVDNYYNHGIYTGWQHWGMAMGTPLLISPIYNKDGNITFKGNRVKAHHWGVSGRPSQEMDYRVLVSYSKNWGTYNDPFEEIEKNVSTLFEWGYAPRWLENWKLTASLAFDRGDLIGNNSGGMITIRKTGIFSR